MRHAWQVVAVAGSIIFSLAVFCAAARADTSNHFNCPDSLTIEIGKGHLLEALTPGKQRPSAGAATSADLAAHASYSAMSYDMYEAFNTGADPTSKLTRSLTLVALIYGEPGLDDLRLRPNAPSSRTFYGFVADEPASGRRLVVIRGTLQPVEWVRDSQAGLRPFVSNQLNRPLLGAAENVLAKAWVHAGFLKIFASLEVTSVADGKRTKFANALPALVSGRQVTFVGHSLGAAVATLAGVEAARRSPVDAAQMRIITYASPRVGNTGFAELAKAVGRIDRVCSVVDAVPMLPTSTRATLYIHVGTVFKVSPFDWPGLNNELERPVEKVTCWHGIAQYAYMLEPSKRTQISKGCALAR
ncbi:MAG: lipase family protein [Hyphomicrobiaceae bacterium]|nr:lipase family protein [Hyphomicrobiaceae bacterium]